MLLIDNGDSHDPAFNLALEEYCLLNLPMEPGYLLMYVNDPCIVVGKHQNVWEEINTDLVEEHRIPVLRRISGGGTVYHDPGNLNFSFLRPHHSQLFNNYTHFTGAVAEALQGMGVPAALNARGDILIGERKISGSAQAMRQGRLCSHGTLLFRADLKRISPFLRPKPGTFTSRSRQSVRSPVANAGDHLPPSFTITHLQRALADALLPHPVQHYTLTPAQLAQVDTLAATKYRTWEWNYAESPPFTVERSGFVDGVEVSVKVAVEKGLVKEVKFHGNLPGSLGTTELERALTGVRYQAEAVLRAMRSLPVEGHKLAMATEELTRLVY